MKFSIKDFFSKCDQIRSFLRICSHLLKKSLMENFIFCAVLLTRIIKLERNAVTNSQYSRKEKIELNHVPTDITENVLEENICKAFPLTGVNVIPNDLAACHRIKRSDKVTVKFKYCKQKNSIMYKRKNLGNKSQELTNLKLSGRLFVGESMSQYKCCRRSI